MNPIELTGLRADLPIGAMAAFGCLRICERIPAFGQSKLSWKHDGGSFHAVLWTDEKASRDDLAAALLEDVRNAASRHELTWSEQIKSATPEAFVENARNALQQATAEDRNAADWFAAFGNQLVLTKKGTIRPTPLDMTGGQQKFLASALKLALDLATDTKKGKQPKDKFAEALYGPWKYEEDQHSWGWDSSTLKFGAFTGEAPTVMANSGVPAALWLAFESLPLFPCFYHGGPATKGFEREGRTVALRWPVWSPPVTLATVRTLLGLDMADVADPTEFERRGILAIYKSSRVPLIKDYATFQFPEVVWAAE